MLSIKKKHFISETIFEIPALKQKITDLENDIAQESFWDNNDQAQSIFETLNRLKNTVQDYSSIIELSDDVGVYIELSDEKEGSQESENEAETLLFLAARAELANKNLFSDFKKNKIVICDRFSDSTLAYQGYGKKMDIEIITRCNKFATNNLEPVLTFILDIDENYRDKFLELAIKHDIGVRS